MKATSGLDGHVVFRLKEEGARINSQCLVYLKEVVVFIPRLYQTALNVQLQAIILGKVSPESVINSDKWRGYDGLVDIGYDKHFRINHDKKFVSSKAHINGIESFWSFTKRRLSKFNGYKKNFHLHLKESEWRWNKDLSTLNKELSALFFSIC